MDFAAAAVVDTAADAGGAGDAAGNASEGTVQIGGARGGRRFDWRWQAGWQWERRDGIYCQRELFLRASSVRGCV